MEFSCWLALRSVGASLLNVWSRYRKVWSPLGPAVLTWWDTWPVLTKRAHTVNNNIQVRVFCVRTKFRKIFLSYCFNAFDTTSFLYLFIGVFIALLCFVCCFLNNGWNNNKGNSMGEMRVFPWNISSETSENGLTDLNLIEIINEVHMSQTVKIALAHLCQQMKTLWSVHLFCDINDC